MRITCPECHTQYNLDAAKLSPRGQTVRCTKCGYMWDYVPPKENVSDESETIPPDYTPQTLPATHQSFAEILAEGDDGEFSRKDAPEMPSFVSADIHVAPPAAFIDHRPFGLSANGFAAMLALILFGVTFSGFLLAKHAIVSRYPPALALYELIGAKVKAPGEGLRLSAIEARKATSEDGKSVLNVTGKLENISDAAQDYPSLRFTAKSRYGAELHSWDFHPDHAVLTAGETIPIKFSFDNPPADTTHIDVTAIAK